MALYNDDVRFLVHAKHRGVDFARTALLGRTSFWADPDLAVRLLRNRGIAAESLPEQLTQNKGFAEPFFHLLGAESIASFDASDYEGATDIVNLNRPIPSHYEQQFSCVIDAGTIEHVFDAVTAYKSALKMVRPGGYFIALAPANNFCGHGFIQFSPEFYIDSLSEQNGFELDFVILRELRENAPWYRVDWENYRGVRYELCNRRPVFISVIARRTRIADLDAMAPIQGDWPAYWENDHAGHQSRSLKSRLREVASRRCPGLLASYQNWRLTREREGGFRQRPYYQRLSGIEEQNIR